MHDQTLEPRIEDRAILDILFDDPDRPAAAVRQAVRDTGREVTTEEVETVRSLLQMIRTRHAAGGDRVREWALTVLGPERFAELAEIK